MSNLYDSFQLIHTYTGVANRIKCSEQEKGIIELGNKVITSSKLSLNYKHLVSSLNYSRDQIHW